MTALEITSDLVPIELGTSETYIQGVAGRLVGLTADTQAGYVKVNEGIRECVKLRSLVERHRKDLKRSAIKWGKRVDGDAAHIRGKILEIEMPLREAKQLVDQREELERQERERIEREEREAIERAEREAKEAEEKALRDEIKRQQDLIELERKRQAEESEALELQRQQQEKEAKELERLRAELAEKKPDPAHESDSDGEQMGNKWGTNGEQSGEQSGKIHPTVIGFQPKPDSEPDSATDSDDWASDKKLIHDTIEGLLINVDGVVAKTERGQEIMTSIFNSITNLVMTVSRLVEAENGEEARQKKED